MKLQVCSLTLLGGSTCAGCVVRESLRGLGAWMRGLTGKSTRVTELALLLMLSLPERERETSLGHVELWPLHPQSEIVAGGVGIS